MEKGYAKLNDTAKATKQEIEAQNQAQSTGLGMWNQKPPSPPSPNGEGIDWSEIWEKLWKWVLLGAGLGFGSLSSTLSIFQKANSPYLQALCHQHLEFLNVGFPSKVDPNVKTKMSQN